MLLYREPRIPSCIPFDRVNPNRSCLLVNSIFRLVPVTFTLTWYTLTGSYSKIWVTNIKRLIHKLAFRFPGLSNNWLQIRKNMMWIIRAFPFSFYSFFILFVGKNTNYWVNSNRPFRFPEIHFQNEVKCKTFVVKMSFICMRIKKSFSYQQLRTLKPCFETETYGNSEMTLTFYFITFWTKVRISWPVQCSLYYEVQKFTPHTTLSHSLWACLPQSTTPTLVMRMFHEHRSCWL